MPSCMERLEAKDRAVSSRLTEEERSILTFAEVNRCSLIAANAQILARALRRLDSQRLPSVWHGPEDKPVIPEGKPWVDVFVDFGFEGASTTFSWSAHHDLGPQSRLWTYAPDLPPASCEHCGAPKAAWTK